MLCATAYLPLHSVTSLGDEVPSSQRQQTRLVRVLVWSAAAVGPQIPTVTPLLEPQSQTCCLL